MRFNATWHPLRITLPFLRDALSLPRDALPLPRDALPLPRDAMDGHTPLKLAPRIALRLTSSPVDEHERLAGTGSLDQILGDLGELNRLGASTVVLDPYHGDPEETRRPGVAWRALTAVATSWRTES